MTGGVPTGGGYVLKNLGQRAVRRVQPRFWVAVAVAGCLLGIAGILTISGDAQVEDDGAGGSNAPGAIFCLAVVVTGYLLLHFFRDAPAATAGVTAVVLGLPPAMWFLTFDENDVPPFSVEAMLFIPALVWLASYLGGPGRGRSLLLGAGLVFAWLFVLEAIEDPFGARPVDRFEFGFGDATGDDFSDDSSFDNDSSFDDDFSDDSIFGDSSGSSDDEAAWGTLGTVSLLFGTGYFVASRMLDRRGYAGTATPFFTVGHVAVPVGIAMLADDLGPGGTGMALLAFGLVLAWLAARAGRRATMVLSVIWMTLGLFVMVVDTADQDTSPGDLGVTLWLVGTILVVVAQLLHQATGEPPETTPGPSTFSGRPGPPPGVPGPPAPGDAWPAPAAPPVGPPTGQVPQSPPVQSGPPAAAPTAPPAQQAPLVQMGLPTPPGQAAPPAQPVPTPHPAEPTPPAQAAAPEQPGPPTPSAQAAATEQPAPPAPPGQTTPSAEPAPPEPAPPEPAPPAGSEAPPAQPPEHPAAPEDTAAPEHREN